MSNLLVNRISNFLHSSSQHFQSMLDNRGLFLAAQYVYLFVKHYEMSESTLVTLGELLPIHDCIYALRLYSLYQYALLSRNVSLLERMYVSSMSHACSSSLDTIGLCSPFVYNLSYASDMSLTMVITRSIYGHVFGGTPGLEDFFLVILFRFFETVGFFSLFNLTLIFVFVYMLPVLY